MENDADASFNLKLSGQGFHYDGKVPASIGKRIISLIIQDPASQVPGITVPASAAAPAYSPAAPPDAGASAKAFLASKRPATDIERVACLAFYLTHFRQSEVFKTKDLTLLNSEAALPRFANTANAVKNATKAEYLAPAGGGQKRITMRGEELVKALPDRTAAKAALEAIPQLKKKHSKNRKEARRTPTA